MILNICLKDFHGIMSCFNVFYEPFVNDEEREEIVLKIAQASSVMKPKKKKREL